MEYSQLSKNYCRVTEEGRASDPFAWEGRNHFRSKGYHLGVYKTQGVRVEKGEIVIHHMGGLGNKGWGFGHKAWIDTGQGYTWEGLKLTQTIFEIAVTEKSLTEEEQEKLLDGSF